MPMIVAQPGDARVDRANACDRSNRWRDGGCDDATQERGEPPPFQRRDLGSVWHLPGRQSRSLVTDIRHWRSCSIILPSPI